MSCPLIHCIKIIEYICNRALNRTSTTLTVNSKYLNVGMCMCDATTMAPICQNRRETVPGVNLMVHRLFINK